MKIKLLSRTTRRIKDAAGRATTKIATGMVKSVAVAEAMKEVQIL
jgi:hypothetical protein